MKNSGVENSGVGKFWREKSRVGNLPGGKSPCVEFSAWGKFRAGGKFGEEYSCWGMFRGGNNRNGTFLREIFQSPKNLRFSTFRIFPVNLNTFNVCIPMHAKHWRDYCEICCWRYPVRGGEGSLHILSWEKDENSPLRILSPRKIHFQKKSSNKSSYETWAIFTFLCHDIIFYFIRNQHVSSHVYEIVYFEKKRNNVSCTLTHLIRSRQK